MVITNPPFSLIRPFFDILVENNKQFLFIGAINVVKYLNVIRAEQLSAELVEQLLGDKFNPSETTEQNMRRNNYLQIFDCGTVEVLYRKETLNDKER